MHIQITYKLSQILQLSMEKALVLGKISHRAPRNIIEEIKKTQGVTDADLIFGPYDFYVIFKTETKEMMGDIALKIRSIEGVIDSLTCYVVSLSDIRPEATGPGIERYTYARKAKDHVVGDRPLPARARFSSLGGVWLWL